MFTKLQTKDLKTEDRVNAFVDKFDGKPIFNEFGKVMKGPDYFKPNLSKFIK